MGMIANYQYINDEQLNCLKNFDCERNDVLEEVEEWNEESEMLLDIDKMWDVLHFVLTGVSSCDPIENNPLSEAVVGDYFQNMKDFYREVLEANGHVMVTIY